MAVLNPNNWHWVDKNTLPWTKQYMNDKFLNFEVPMSNETEQIIRVIEIPKISGDSNVSQRKGKPICYFDLNLEFDVKVFNKDNTEESVEDGKLSIPEFMHDEDDFEIRVSGFTPEFQKSVSSIFVPKLRETLLQYQIDLIKEHSADLQH